MSLSPLVRGLSKLLEKGDWTFWMGDGRSYDFTPQDSFDYRVILSRLDDSVSVKIGNGWNDYESITEDERVHLRELCTRLYLEPYHKQVEDNRRSEDEARQTKVEKLVKDLKELGST